MSSHITAQKKKNRKFKKIEDRMSQAESFYTGQWSEKKIRPRFELLSATTARENDTLVSKLGQLFNVGQDSYSINLLNFD